MEGRRTFALLMAMRTGKTKVILDDFGRLEDAGQCQDLAVIAPGGVYKTWDGAAIEHWSPDLLERSFRFVWDDTGTKSQKHDIADFLNITKGPRLLTMNVEALSKVSAAQEMLKAFLNKRKSMCVIDESTIIKNPSSKRTEFINEEIGPLAEWRRILSGLIAPRSPLDLYSQFEFLDRRILGHRSFYGFRATYAILKEQRLRDFWSEEKGRVVKGRKFFIIVGYRRQEELQEKIADHSFRVTLEDCYDVPKSTYAIREVPLTPEQKRIYAEMKRYCTAKLSEVSHVTATVVIAQIIKLHQILCGHVIDENGVEQMIPERRTETLLQLLEEYDGKAIIWCSYDTDIQKVAAALTKEYGPGSVARFWGGNVATREAEEKLFKTDPKCRFIVATASAGGRGRTWSVANLSVYYSSTTDLEHRSQSEERPKAVGKTDKCAYVDLQVPGTVEGKFIRNLREKIDMATVINGDNYMEWLI